ncbi:putative peptide maturation dehydrogenase [Lysobacter sp. KIS68-7]|uniref:putative peptide maturation dehydrogenase n=1 Tax=Lysobacter sp. KIS68-7 TaxID=2904252 RepID=UPI001E54298D|nr:putative peptide maturation dehydrogenase [Lysobacter sp. KIS68-7]UHQ20565.1 putative peptide maturation dehydrogenase [Lysobacter sp. KIS68-7]
MLVRRCAVLWLEPRETAEFELDALLSGGTGVVSQVQWFAHAPQLEDALVLEDEDVLLLGRLSPTDWVQAGLLRDAHGNARVDALLQLGLLVTDDAGFSPQHAADERYRAQHWFGLSAIAHARSRWVGLDAAREVAEAGVDTAAGLVERYGTPPPVLHADFVQGDSHALPRVPHTAFDALLDRRSSCRNFDKASVLPMAAFSHVVERVFGARGQVKGTEVFDMVKKTSPSGGAMHATEAYFIVHRVEGLAPGLYHYNAIEHAMRPIAWEGTPEALEAFARLAVGGQDWFSDAPVQVALVPRFARNYWKYQNHPKAYRVAILDVGHLSQTLLLTATELGLGAFITAAINEIDIERAFGLTSFVESPIAVCGFGIRADRMTTPELDPNRTSWPR